MALPIEIYCLDVAFGCIRLNAEITDRKCHYRSDATVIPENRLPCLGEP